VSEHEASSAAAARTESRARRALVYTLIAFAGVLLVLTTFSVWVDRVALNTEGFADTSADLIEDESIRRAVATRTIDELYDAVDVEAELEGPLPEDVESLAGPTAAGLRQVAPGIVERALEQPALQRLWRSSIEQTHATLVEVLEAEGETVSTEGGVVTLDLGEIVREAADRIGVSDTVEDRIGPDTGRIEVLRSDELDTAQDAFQLLNASAWILPLLTAAVFALALWVSAGRRRLTVRGLGIAVFLSGVVGLLAVNLTGNYLVGRLAEDRESRDAGGSAWDIVTDLLRGSFRLQIVIGLLVLLAAWAAGPTASAVAVRRSLAPGLRERRYAYGALTVVALLILLTGSASDFARILGELVVIGLLIAWVELTRGQTLREFPDAAGSPIFGDVRAQLSGWLGSLRTEGPDAGQSAGPGDLTARLEQLAGLHARGELTDDEYAAAKARVLSGS